MAKVRLMIMCLGCGGKGHRIVRGRLEHPCRRCNGRGDHPATKARERWYRANYPKESR